MSKLKRKKGMKEMMESVPESREMAVRQAPVKKFIRPVVNQPLSFKASAYAKLIWFRDYKDIEICGFGMSTKENPLLVYDFILAPQIGSGTRTDFDTDKLADFEIDMAEKGYDPVEWERIWVHTHPSMSASPSGPDEENLEEVYGKANWAVMAIVSKSDDYYARLVHNEGPRSSVKLAFGVNTIDWSLPINEINEEDLIAEYEANVSEVQAIPLAGIGGNRSSIYSSNYYSGFGGAPSGEVNTYPDHRGGYVDPAGEYNEQDATVEELTSDHEDNFAEGKSVYYDTVIRWAKRSGWLLDEDEEPDINSTEFHELFIEWNAD